jgi:UDP-3-O-[3-hydroxymyristoyl] glucosamine N-acyltransferase
MHLEKILKESGGTLVGPLLSDDIVDVASLVEATKGSVTFFVSEQGDLAALAQTKASLVILDKKHQDHCSVSAYVCSHPRWVFAKIAKAIKPYLPVFNPGVDASAVVDASTSISDSVHVGPFAYIGAHVTIGEGVIIESHVVIEDGVTLGNDCHIHAHAVIKRLSVLGARCVVQSQAVIGSYGFGYAPTPDRRWAFLPHYGHVVLENEVEIGAGTTIDRGTFSDTRIGEGVKLDNQIQIGHNVHIGAHTVMAGCTGVAGSTKIGRHCMIGGACVIGGHLDITDGVILTGHTAVQKSIKTRGVYSSALNAQPSFTWRKNLLRLHKLDAILRRIAGKGDKHDNHDD